MLVLLSGDFDGKAFPAFERPGSRSAVPRLGYQFEHGLGVPVNYPEAIKWYHLAAEAGSNDGRCALGWMYEHGEGKQDYQEAIKWYRLAADAGDNAGRNAMGWMYEQGLGVHRDLAEAARWYGKAANAGDDRGRENRARILLAAKAEINDGGSEMSVTNGAMPN